MKSALLLSVLSMLPGGLAHADEPARTFSQASDLVPWCESEAKARYIGRNITPYQWTASYHDSGDVLVVDGKLRVHGDDVPVHCRSARGAREQFATIAIDDPAL